MGKTGVNYTKQYKETIKEELILEYRSMNSLTKLGKKYQISRQTLASWFKGWKEPIRVVQKTKLNSNIWTEKLTEEHWYWLGFILADGCVRVRKSYSEFSLKLKGSDIGHLEKFKSFINYEGSIKTSNTYLKVTGKTYKLCHISFGDNQFCKGLTKLGIIPNKSRIKYNFNYPTTKKDSNSFVRGYMDGDGCLTLRSSTKKLRGSAVGQQSICEFIKTTIGCGCVYSQNGLYIYEGSFSNPEKLYKIYGPNSISLDRKQIIFNKYCENVIKKANSSSGEKPPVETSLIAGNSLEPV